MADDFQTYRSKSTRKRKADQMEVDTPQDTEAGEKKKVEFKAMSSKEVDQQVSLSVKD